MGMREIVVSHDLSRGPLSAVRRMLVHSSIAEIGSLGLYDTYVDQIPRSALDRIKELIGPGWMPVELAIAHYTACDKLHIEDEAIFRLGLRAGDKMGSALLVAGAQPRIETKDRSPWPLLPAFARMGRRIYDGASAQYVRTGPNSLQVEYYGNPLFSFHYYRVAHTGFMHQGFRALSVDIKDVAFTPYRDETASVDVRILFR
jgi:hypothetical protein